MRITKQAIQIAIVGQVLVDAGLAWNAFQNSFWQMHVAQVIDEMSKALAELLA